MRNIFGRTDKESVQLTQKQYCTFVFYIRERAKVYLKFSSSPKDGYDIHRFSNSKWVLSKLQEQNIEFDDELIEDLNEVRGQNDDEVEWRED